MCKNNLSDLLIIHFEVTNMIHPKELLKCDKLLKFSMRLYLYAIVKPIHIIYQIMKKHDQIFNIAQLLKLSPEF